MEGFFTKKEVQSNSRPDGKTYSCASCGLIQGCKTPRMKPWGKFGKGILNIGSFPSDMDDAKGKPFQDNAGRFLQEEYTRLGIDLFEDCLNINAVNCAADAVTPYQITCCRKSILKIIKEYQPSIIVLFGIEAVQSVIGHRFQNDLGSIEKWRGWCIPDQDYKAWVCPIFYPKYIHDSSKEYKTIWRQDLQRIVDHITIKFPKDKEPVIDVIEDLRPLNKIKNGSSIAFDYETTGIKPHDAGHRIICCSIADTPMHAYVFMMPETKQEREPFINLLKNKTIGKIAQNMKFEEAWSFVRLKTSVNHWEWDTMLASHILDNRPDITGLKFQTYVRFGVIDYASDVSPWIKSSGKDANEKNRIEEYVKTKAGKDALMKYCALDSIFEYRLALLQMQEMGYDFLPF
jgi:uracil-DNA glycosylase family 4